ncbi:MAG TPA: SIS domain-containing protein [Clostridia bacterium]|nr:SIS domain-containing protein [Clostridia bacterium]
MNTMMEKEIFSQPAALKNTYDTNLVLAEKLAGIIKRQDISQIIVAARGSSNNASLYFKYLCEINVGIPVNFVYPSIITQYKGKLKMKDACVFGVSQSGKALDVRTVLKEAQAQGAVTVAITNDLTSPMALETQYHFYLDVEEEQALAATKTYTAEMLVLQMIVNALLDENTHLPAKMPPVNEYIKQVLDLKPQITELADKYVESDEMIILGRGLNLSSANEIALKLQETCYINARSYAISDFHHGPFAIVNEKSRILILAMNDAVYEDAVNMIEKLKPSKADVTVFTDNKELLNHCEGILLPHVEEIYTPYLCVTAGQLLSCILSQKRGINPDSPRGLNKVTITI